MTLTAPLATKMHGDADSEYRIEWTEVERLDSSFLVVRALHLEHPAVGMLEVRSVPPDPWALGAASEYRFTGTRRRPGPGPAHRFFRALRQLGTLFKAWQTQARRLDVLRSGREKDKIRRLRGEIIEQHESIMELMNFRRVADISSDSRMGRLDVDYRSLADRPALCCL
jgi:hypothetical protein